VRPEDRQPMLILILRVAEAVFTHDQTSKTDFDTVSDGAGSTGRKRTEPVAAVRKFACNLL
jgi:hypothetical protein